MPGSYAGRAEQKQMSKGLGRKEVRERSNSVRALLMIMQRLRVVVPWAKTESG